jgi:SAM-dependent methyltransferase
VNVLRFVRASLPAPPARVLEVGAGSGELAEALAADGYSVVAVDPAGTGSVLPVPLLELDEPPGSFDAAVAVVSLHHVEPLAASCDHLAALVRPGGQLVVDEFDVAVFDERAAAWLLEQRRLCGHEHAEATPATVVADLREHLHSLEDLRAALAPFFDLDVAERGAYLYRWDLDPSLRDAETDLIAAGELPEVGVRLIGTRRH